MNYYTNYSYIHLSTFRLRCHSVVFSGRWVWSGTIYDVLHEVQTLFEAGPSLVTSELGIDIVSR